jgi:NADH-quinone oxidoreductase subunit I
MSRPTPNPVRQYFANIWSGIVTTILGMKLTLGYFFSKPVTMEYPEVKPAIPPGHRGLHKFIEEDCIVCRACAVVCPVDCIRIDAQGKGKDVLLTDYEIDYTKCLFCNLCAEACPTDCILLTEKYDLASYRREDCVIEFARVKPPEELAAHAAMLAQKEAEKKAKLAEAAKKKEAEAAAPPAAGNEG